MAKHVIIHLPHVDTDEVSWAIADDNGKLVAAPSQGSLADAAAIVEGRRATLVVSGDNVLLAEATVPGGSAARAQQAIPFALEEQLADDVDELHFALGPRDKSDNWPVAVLGRETMEQLVALCSDAGLRPSEIVPETLALPLDASRAATDDEPGVASWTALLDGERAVVRLHRHSGFSGEADLVPLMLDGARRELPDGDAAQLRLHHVDPDAELTIPPGIDVDTHLCDSPLSLHAQGLASSPHINLLQGDYSPKQRFDKAWKPWRWTAALAACLCLVFLAGKVLDMRRLQAREAQLDAAIAETFQLALPGARMQRPRRQVQSALDKIGAGGGDTFIRRTSQIAASLATQPQTTLRSIGYRNGRFDLDLTTDTLPTLDALKSQLESRGSLAMSVQSANREDDGVRGRVRVE